MRCASALSHTARATALLLYSSCPMRGEALPCPVKTKAVLRTSAWAVPASTCATAPVPALTATTLMLSTLCPEATRLPVWLTCAHRESPGSTMPVKLTA